MILKPFSLHEPTSAREAASLLAHYGESAKAYAGGTELLLAMKAGFLRYEHLVNVKTVIGLADVSRDVGSGALCIGAAATHRALEESALVCESFPLIADVARRVANFRVRNVGTLGGNLCFAEPHSDPAVTLLLFDAEAEIEGTSGVRRLAIEKLHLGPYESALQEDELLTRVLVPQLPAGMKGVYLKFGYHHRPTLGVGMALKLSAANAIEDIRIAIGSVSAKPMRIRQAEELLRGSAIVDLLPRAGTGAGALVRQAGQIAADSAQPIDDMHGSAEYKKHLVQEFLGKALTAAYREVAL